MLLKVCLAVLCFSVLAVHSWPNKFDDDIVYIQTDEEKHQEGDAVIKTAEPTPTARVMAFQSTITRVQIITVTVTSNTPSLCASLVNVTGSCRRRRRGEDKPIVLSFDEDDEIDLYKPTKVQDIETTAEAKLDNNPLYNDVLESSSSDPVELDIIGLQNGCVAPRFGFGQLQSLLSQALTLRFFTVVNATVTKTVVSTSGSKPFFISACTPSPFLYKTC